MGLVGTGLLAIPRPRRLRLVRGGRALSPERAGLDLKPRRARRFYLVFASARPAAIALSLPRRQRDADSLLLRRCSTGLLAPPLMVSGPCWWAAPEDHGRARQRLLAEAAQAWTATAIMTAAALAFF
jgi:hypothetical protein